MFTESRHPLSHFPALQTLVRSRPVGYFHGLFNDPPLPRNDYAAANKFAMFLSSSYLHIENIQRIEILEAPDAPRMKVYHHEGEQEFWPVEQIGTCLEVKYGYELLRDAMKRSVELRQPAGYTIEDGLLRAFNGGDSWDCVLDVDAYDHFWWNGYDLKAIGRYIKEAQYCLTVPEECQTAEFREKLLEDIYQAKKESRNCVKK